MGGRRLRRVLARPWLQQILDQPAIANWATIFVVAVVVAAAPFLVLGVAVSGAVTAFVPTRSITRVLPGHPALAVPVAAVAGAALPGCECGSVPVARRLMSRGVAPSAALAFLLSSPAINPVVLISTAVAFPGQPEMVLARALASLAAALAVGWWWAAPAATLQTAVPRSVVDFFADSGWWSVLALRFVPVTFACALGAATLFGWWLL